jgi:hypothetical protein
MRWLGDTYHLNMLLPQLADVLANRTTDGKPLRIERVPTAADIGKPVKCKDHEMHKWFDRWNFVGFRKDGRFVVESPTQDFTSWNYCIIDEEAAQ